MIAELLPGSETEEGILAWPGPLSGDLADAVPLHRQASDIAMRLPMGRPLRLGLISDTHLTERGPQLPAGALRLLERSDAILHAGDVACEQVLDELRRIAPVFAVRGNVDPFPWARELPVLRSFRAGPWRVVLVHDAGQRAGRAARARAKLGPFHALIFGHSHQPGAWRDQGTLLVNPGSATQPRRAPLPTVARLDVSDRLVAEIWPLIPA